MTRFQRISANAISALKDALASVFWFKRDLYRYLQAAVRDPKLLARIDWDNQYKRDSINQFVDRLVANEDRHSEVLMRLMGDVAAMEDFPGLRRTDDPKKKIADAKEAVERLRRYFKPYEAALLEGEQNRARIEKTKAEAELRRATSKRLAQLKERFNELMLMDDAHRRGFDFEPFIRELFDTFDLDPKASFKVEGEQIDGGFTLSGTHFLLEARWRKELADREALDGFAAKVRDKAENTLGLFISMSGFEPGAVQKHSGKQSALLLMDGGEVLAALEERIDLVELLNRKHRHASMTGEIYRRADDFLT